MSILKSDKGLSELFAKGLTKGKIPLLLLVGVALIALSLTMGQGREAKDEGMEARIAEMCSMTEGVGDCRVMITYSDNGDEVYAVAVLCSGADSPAVRQRLTDMVCSLFGIGANRVSILKITE